MKSGKTCYDPAISHVTLKRFSPICILYTVGMILLAIGNVHPDGSSINAAEGVLNLCSLTPICNLIYAAVLAQLLMGDLYTPRLSYALHSLPVTLGGWFGTQVILGIVSVFPGILISGGILLANVTRFQSIVPIWMASALLSFLFFFALALLSAVCAGNRIGMLLLDGILNFWGLFFGWAKIRIFCPLIYGFYLENYTPKTVPISNMLEAAPFEIVYVNALQEVQDGTIAYFGSREIDHLEFTGYLWLMLLYAAVGCILIGLSMYLLRRRKPECAGDLLAFRVTEPVLLIICSVFCGILFHVVSNLFSWQMGYPMLLVGIIVGYYATLMLLRRQANVFSGKSVLPLAIILVMGFVSITATGLNLFGITYRIPSAEQVEKVTLRVWGEDPLESSAPEDIALAIEVQTESLAQQKRIEQSRPLLERIYGSEEQAPYPNGDTGVDSGMVSIVYTLKNGKQLSRLYYIFNSFSCIRSLRERFSAPEFVLCGASVDGDQEQFLDADGKFDPQLLLDLVQGASLNCWHSEDALSSGRTWRIADTDIPGLIDAILKDCEEKTTAQASILSLEKGCYDSVVIYYADSRLPYSANIYIDLNTANVNTMGYLIAHGYHAPLADEPVEP